MQPVIDILGLAQSMVDITTVDAIADALLPSLGVEKGGRRVLQSVDERHEVLQTLEEAGCATKISPGGSLANTLVAISRLSLAATATNKGWPQLNIALGTNCGSDPISQFFSSQLNSAGVAVVPVADACAAPGHTGTVFVLPSADAQRSFLSFFHSEAMTVGPGLLQSAARARLVVVEGYLWELPQASETIPQLVAAARAGGAKVVLTAGDPGVVARHRQSIQKVLEAGGQDILFFCNMEEACELVGAGRSCCARWAAEQLGLWCSVAVVTDGSRGSHVACAGQVHSALPMGPPSGGAIIDTCGAGDAYAAGFLFAMASGCASPSDSAIFAGRVAACVISRHGAQLHEDEALELVELLSLESADAASGAALPSLLRPAATMSSVWAP